MNKLISLFFLLTYSVGANTQVVSPPSVVCGSTVEQVKMDGILDEQAWQETDPIGGLLMVEPLVNAAPSLQTVVRVMASQKDLYIGIECFGEGHGKIVAYSKARDSELENEDYIKVILDTYRDGRNGYIFAINPFGARYDALVSHNGESENPNWDGAWDAHTHIGDSSWSAEIRIPVSTLTYNGSLRSWGFNIERRIQRLLEVDRWSGISLDYTIGHTRHAGLLTELPDFSPGIGLTPRASLTTKAMQAGEEKASMQWQPSLDLTQRITSDVTAQLTVNTDFAETEVDSRQTNLTRFPVLYPEKRQFFLEGADIFDFGLSLNGSVMPFYSRRIGLYEGGEVPVLLGGKINGKVNNTHFGSLVTRTAPVDSLVPGSTMGVVRVRQNILKESSFGMIATLGDPAGRTGAYTIGADFTFQTTSFLNGKNFLVGAWGILNDRQGLEGDRSAAGLKIDYPNDLWDCFFQFRRIGDAFDPSAGFIYRTSIFNYAGKVDYMPRPAKGPVRQYRFQVFPSLFTDLNHTWESYELSVTPLDAQLESGDRFALSFTPQGENLPGPFEISDGVVIDPGSYHYTRYRLEASTASKRAINGKVEYSSGGFYGGKLDQVELQVNCRIMSFLVLEFIYENNIGKIPAGNFTKELMSVRTAVNINSNVNLSILSQFDNESNALGTYARFRWTFAPLGDLFIVYKHNIRPELTDRWSRDQNQLIVKLTYGLAL